MSLPPEDPTIVALRDTKKTLGVFAGGLGMFRVGSRGGSKVVGHVVKFYPSTTIAIHNYF
jgi:hypothetical protein